MATSVPTPRLTSHARSISLPSSSHPLITNVEEHLQRLKSPANASASSSSHTLTYQRLDGLKKLYECVDDVLQLPLSRQALSSERCSKWEEDVLDGSLKLLDICSAMRDIYSQMKGSVLELESFLRRKICGEVESEIQMYMNSKKNLNKMTTKCFNEIKKLAAVKKDSSSDTILLVSLMKQVQEASATVFESTLSLISSSSKSAAGWSLVSKLLQQKKASQQELSLIQTVEVVLKSCKEGDVIQMRKIVKTLEDVDSNIQELAEVLDIVFRILVKTRVSLLNIVNC